jgi:hypothetical protein
MHLSTFRNLMALLVLTGASTNAALFDIDPTEQDNKDLYCRNKNKAFANCVIADDYAGGGVWNGAQSCADTYKPAVDYCKASYYLYVALKLRGGGGEQSKNNNALYSSTSFLFGGRYVDADVDATIPAYFVTGWITARGQVEAYMVAPGSIDKVWR